MGRLSPISSSMGYLVEYLSVWFSSLNNYLLRVGSSSAKLLIIMVNSLCKVYEKSRNSYVKSSLCSS